MKRGLGPIFTVSFLLMSVAAMWAAPASAQTVPAASTREAPLSEAQREALQDIADTAGTDTARLLKAQTAAIQALSAQIKRLEARVTLLEQQR